MSTIPVPFQLPGFHIDHVHDSTTTLIVHAHAITPTATCPQCQQDSRRVHSYYHRAPRDLPMSEHPVQLHLQVRRFRCRTPQCPQRTFAERLPTLVPVAARRTVRLTATLQTLAFTAGGEGGARAGAALHIPVSPDTLLRITRRATCAARPIPRVLGVDDFALRKGSVYGTILVDLERQRPVDLLPDRTAATLASWLQQHPGVAIIARDRSTEYARGATLGAPHARQVADRWHLLQNLREALERMLNRRHATLRCLPLPPQIDHAIGGQPLVDPPPARPTLRMPSATERVTSAVARERRYARYQAVRRLSKQGVPILQIAKRLGMSRVTVRRYLQAEGFPERALRQRAPSMLDPYLYHLRQRWAAGCHNASHLWREIRAIGYPGTRKQVERWAHQQRREPAPSTPHIYRESIRKRQASSLPPLATARQLAWLLVRTPAALPAPDVQTLRHITQDRDVAVSYELAQQFLAMVRERRADAFAHWLAAGAASGIAELQTFVAGLHHEYESVYAALTEPWSTGPVEGHINRLKLVKRQMFGRANFDLLKQRVLYARR